MASQMSINAAQFSDEHLDPLVAVSYKHKQKQALTLLTALRYENNSDE